MRPCIWVRNLCLGKDLVILGTVPNPKMADKDHCLKLEMRGRKTFPSPDIIILGLTGIEEDLPEGDKNSSIKIELEPRQEVDPFLQ